MEEIVKQTSIRAILNRHLIFQPNLKNCKDLALQLFEHDDIDVIMGGGREWFVDRNDKRNLIQEWKVDENVTFVETESELQDAMKNLSLEKRLIGIYANRHMEYEYVREQFAPEEPQLRLMAEAAIKKLSLNPNGFYLFVEGGKIDLAHHDTMPVKSLYDWKEFDTMIGNSLQMVDLNETIVMVSADHSHTFSIGAYGARGENIFGPGKQQSPDGENVMILGYANGPGYNIHKKEDNQTGEIYCSRRMPSEYKDEWDTSNGKKPFSDLRSPTSVTNINPSTGTNGETHGAEDVPVYAEGPWAHLMTGTHEQVMVAHIMEFAMCIGDYTEEEHCVSAARNGFFSVVLFVIYFLVIFE